jgi:hypothetical protein
MVFRPLDGMNQGLLAPRAGLEPATCGLAGRFVF